MEIKKKPNEIFEEYRAAHDYKNSIGDRGIYDQSRMNERFYVGDQWRGVQAGNTRPLVRRNIIKRIGEYKISALCAAPVAINYSADGVPDTSDMKTDKRQIEQDMYQGMLPNDSPTPEEIAVVMSALSDYQTTTAERVKFNEKTEQMAKSAYISGTAFLYTYWDGTVETGLFADNGKTQPIRGDINCEVLNVVNVNLGDPNNDDIQSQPYITISQRKPIEEVKREAKRNRQTEEIDADSNDVYDINAGDWGEKEPSDSSRVTVLTKFWKEYEEDTHICRVKAIRVTENTVVRKEWDLGIRLYPLAKFVWERRFSCGYGDSEVTYLIPNQIAINRALSAAVWGAMMTGMPKMIVNTDLVRDTVTNDPGQVLRINAGQDYDVQRAIGYVHPPQFSAQFQNLVTDIANNTLSDSGANDAALGNIRPDNASAIIAMREAALQPMQIYQNRFYSTIEDVARIWADFWLNMYDRRPLKIQDKNGTRYLPFEAARYRNLVVNARVDVGASTLWGEAVVVSSLGNLLQMGIITPQQYLQRIPKNTIPDVTGIIEEMNQQQQNTQMAQQELIAQFAQQYPEQYAVFEQMPPEQQQQMLQQMMEQEGAQ